MARVLLSLGAGIVAWLATALLCLFADFLDSREPVRWVGGDVRICVRIDFGAGGGDCDGSGHVEMA
jgi:hypothetical protein